MASVGPSAECRVPTSETRWPCRPSWCCCPPSWLRPSCCFALRLHSCLGGSRLPQAPSARRGRRCQKPWSWRLPSRLRWRCLPRAGGPTSSPWWCPLRSSSPCTCSPRGVSRWRSELLQHFMMPGLFLIPGGWHLLRLKSSTRCYLLCDKVQGDRKSWGRATCDNCAVS